MGAPRRSSELGLTLMEVIIVMFILAIVSSTVIMSLPARGSNLDVESRRLTLTLGTLADRSVLTGQSHAMRVEPDGYRSFIRVGGNWRELPALSRQVPDPLFLDIRRNRRLSLRRETENDTPDIIFSAAGFTPDAILELSNGQDLSVIELGNSGASS